MVKFDGYSFHTFSTENGLSNNSINTLLVDEKDRIWAGTENGGISVLSDNQVKIIDQESGLRQNKIVGLFEDSKNRIWCVYPDGISCIENNKIRNFDDVKGFNGLKDVQHIVHLVDRQGNVWISTMGGLFVYFSVMRNNVFI